MFVFDCPDDEGVRTVGVVCNPVLTLPEGKDRRLDADDEGCLSFPGAFVECARPDWARVDGFGLDGEPVHFEGDGLLARCLQHETDHTSAPSSATGSRPRPARSSARSTTPRPRTTRSTGPPREPGPEGHPRERALPAVGGAADEPHQAHRNASSSCRASGRSPGRSRRAGPSGRCSARRRHVVGLGRRPLVDHRRRAGAPLTRAARPAQGREDGAELVAVVEMPDDGVSRLEDSARPARPDRRLRPADQPGNIGTLARSADAFGASAWSSPATPPTPTTRRPSAPAPARSSR